MIIRFIAKQPCELPRAAQSAAALTRSYYDSATRRALSSRPFWAKRLALVAALAALTCSLVPLANAQEGLSVTGISSQQPSGWWSPERPSTASTPHLLISMRKLNVFGAYPGAGAVSQTSPSPSIDLTPDLFAYALGQKAIASATGISPDRDEANDVPRNALSPSSFFASLEGRYLDWEGSLADTRTSTDVNKMTVYPIIELEIRGKSLPICLFTLPSVR